MRSDTIYFKPSYSTRLTRDVADIWNTSYDPHHCKRKLIFTREEFERNIDLIQHAVDKVTTKKIR